MGFCRNCGKELPDESAFCNVCGTAVSSPAPKAESAPTTDLVPTATTISEEQEFLDLTHRLLRWERTAWSIAGKAFLIVGIVFAALFSLLGFIMFAVGDYVTETLGVVYLLYGVLFGSMFIALGIVNRKAADKIPFYMNNLYTDFRYTYDRCGSVGMLVFSVILGAISPIFFIINFARMKANSKLIQQIIEHQQQI